MNNQYAADGFLGQLDPSPAASLDSCFGGSSGEDSGYAGSPLFGTVDPPLFGTVNPSHLSVGNDFPLFPPNQSAKFGRFTENIKTEDSSSQVQPVQAKKEVKKRKSWGQQLPDPTTHLPPR